MSSSPSSSRPSSPTGADPADRPRRVSPRLHGQPPNQPIIPPPGNARPPIQVTRVPCPLCPTRSTDLFQHCRKAHSNYPFLQADFNDQPVSVCGDCGSVLKPSTKAVTNHRTHHCPGLTDAMTTRRSGATVADARGRSSSSSSPVKTQRSPSTPLRKTTSAPSGPSLSRSSSNVPPPSSPLARHSSHAESPQDPDPQDSEPQDLVPPSTLGAATQAAQAAATPIRLTPDELLELPGSLPHLHPKLVPAFLARIDTLASSYNSDPSEANLYNIVAFVKVGINPALRHGHTATINRIAAYPDVPLPESTERSTPSDDRVKRARKLIESGLVGKAERALNDAAKVATLTPEVLQQLEDKHPLGSPNPFGTPPPASSPMPELPNLAAIERAIASFSPDTSPGPSGWTPRLLSVARSSAPFMLFLTSLTGQIAAGIAPGQTLLCAATLTPLIKPSGGVRPIAVGEIFYRLAMKAIFAANNRPEMLLPNQYGIGSKGGVEPITRAVQYAFDNHPAFPYSHVLTLDSINAFNTLRRPHLSSAINRHAAVF